PALRQVEDGDGMVARVAMQEGAAHLDRPDACRQALGHRQAERPDIEALHRLDLPRGQYDVTEAGFVRRPCLGDTGLDARAERVSEDELAVAFVQRHRRTS